MKDKNFYTISLSLKIILQLQEHVLSKHGPHQTQKHASSSLLLLSPPGRSTCQPFWTSEGWLGRQSVRRSSTSSKTSRPATAARRRSPGTAPSSLRCQSPLRSTAWTSAWAALPSLPLPASPRCDRADAKPERPSRKTLTMLSEESCFSGFYDFINTV